MNGYGVLVEWYRQGTTEVLGEKPITLPLCPPQISHLLAWAMAQLAPNRIECWASHSGCFTRCPWIWGRAISQLTNWTRIYKIPSCPQHQTFIKKHNNNQFSNTTQIKREKHTINRLKDKLATNRAIATKADRGNAIVITYQDFYHNKVLNFIADNNFTTINNNSTKTFQKKDVCSTNAKY